MTQYPLWPEGPSGFRVSDELVGYAHWDNDHWTVFPPATMADGRRGEGISISGSSATNIWAVGQAPGFAEHYDGHTWSRSLELAYPDDFQTVVATCEGNVWAAGLSPAPGPIYRYDGNTWTPMAPSFLPTGSLVTSMAAVANGDAWVGSNYPYYSGTANMAPGVLYHFRP